MSSEEVKSSPKSLKVSCSPHRKFIYSEQQQLNIKQIFEVFSTRLSAIITYFYLEYLPDKNKHFDDFFSKIKNTNGITIK